MSLEPGCTIFEGKYRVLRKLDEGRFGHVYKIENVETGKYYALKSINRNEIKRNRELRANLDREIRIHCQLDHPNIIKIIQTGRNRSRKFIVLEYARLGDLWDHLYDDFDSSSDDSSEYEYSQHFTESESREYFRQIINALIYLRDKKIIHRDLKPENILLMEDNTIKIADFGWATDKVSNSHVGTTRYNSPEMIFSQKPYNYRTDLWSSGIILYEFLIGDAPFVSKSETKLEDKINNGVIRFPERPRISDEAKDLIVKILRHYPRDRISYEEILAHPWMNKAPEEKNNDNDDDSNSLDENELESNISDVDVTEWDSEIDPELEAQIHQEIDAELDELREEVIREYQQKIINYKFKEEIEIEQLHFNDEDILVNQNMTPIEEKA